jgi:anti-sigma regulatory factor (Ser/Thr protein kinase)
MERTDIKEFIIREVIQHPSDIVPLVARSFHISRQRAYFYVKREVENKTLIKTGRTSSTKYFLSDGNLIEVEMKIEKDLSEDKVWATYIKPLLKKFPDNIYRICNYGFTEIYNNAIDHSEGNKIFTKISIEHGCITIIIMDNGIGIFQKIQNALHLDSMRESILHLSKGKFTTDPERHSGQGIFFTSRVFDKFSIFSSYLFYTFSNGDWFMSSEKRQEGKSGTFIRMSLSIQSERNIKDVMDTFSGVDTGFTKTIVAVQLSEDPNDPHVSRSQAKKLLMGLDKFRQVVLDFKGVKSVGQAFVDEVFRVYKDEHPAVDIHYINANEDVDYMIKRGIADSN